MKRLSLKNASVILLAFALAGLGILNLHRKATSAVLEDGAFWNDSPGGVVASRVSSGGPAARAGLRPGDVLLAMDGKEVLSAREVEETLEGRRAGERLAYSVLRADEKRALEVVVLPLPQGNVTLFYYLSLMGFFSLVHVLRSLARGDRPREAARPGGPGVC